VQIELDPDTPRPKAYKIDFDQKEVLKIGCCLQGHIYCLPGTIEMYKIDIFPIKITWNGFYDICDWT